PADLDWEGRYGVAERLEPANLDTCTAVAFSPDGRWLIAGTRSGWLVRWDLEADDPRPRRWRHAPPTGHPRPGPAGPRAFAPSGGVLVSTDGLRMNAWDARQDWRQLAGWDRPFAQIVRKVRSKDELLVRLESHLFRVTDERPFLANSVECAGELFAAGPG